MTNQNLFISNLSWIGVFYWNKRFQWSRAPEALSKLKKSVGWTIDKFRLNNSLAINGTILRFAYRKIDVQRRTCTNFWDFCCSYHQIIAVWILVSEGRDKKGRFVETNSSEYSISKSKMQVIFESGFNSHTIK